MRSDPLTPALSPADGGEGGGTVAVSPPAEALRLFPHHEAEEVAAHPQFVIGRLLEDGDGADLCWLFATVGEEAVRRWFAERGGRQLSARSRAFWRLALQSEPSAPATGSEDLWPL